MSRVRGEGLGVRREKQAEQKFWHNKTYLVSSEGTLQRWVLELLKWGKGAGISRGDVARGIGPRKRERRRRSKGDFRDLPWVALLSGPWLLLFRFSS